MSVPFVQPDPYTCVPTSFAYLVHKQKKHDFKNVLDQLIEESYRRFNNIRENGMEFDQMQQVASTLNFTARVYDTKPPTTTYLTGVTKLPRQEFEYNDFIHEAVEEDSLQIEHDYFIYPYGHAVAVFENTNNNATVFDSLFGTETVISLAELENYLEHPTSYLSLV